MKHLNTIILGLIVLALAVLYFLHFAQSKKVPGNTLSSEVKSGSVAYVNIDTLLTKMEMYKDIQVQLAKKQQDLESNFAMRYKAFENNVNEVQKRFSDPTAIITQIQREQVDQQLSNQRTELETLQNTYMNQMQKENADANRKIYQYIMDYLKDYTKGKEIQYIFSYGFGGNILYSDSELEVTTEVLYGLNEKYLKEKSVIK